MIAYRCRVVVPVLAVQDWTTVEALSPEEAVQDFHFHHATDGTHSLVLTREAPREDVYFARVEVDEHGTWVSRIFKSQIRRKGGVKRQRPTEAQRLVTIAKTLGWEGDPMDLIAAGWDLEEAEGS